ncbi:hypothetical protein [uncultured Roseibium sp.]|uniref:hypothetical protein n=1 Tax=uncultured Roseibium sp. TaxID=1936171 RepID=UPI00321640AD
MRFPGSYFHVYVFAVFFIGFGLAVANDPVAFEGKVRPTVREVAAVFEEVEDYVYNSKIGAMAEETSDLFAKTLRLPTTLLEKVSDALEKARKEAARPVRYEEEPSIPDHESPAETSRA